MTHPIKAFFQGRNDEAMLKGLPVNDAGGVQCGGFVLAVQEDFPPVLEKEVSLDDVEPQGYGGCPGGMLSAAYDVDVKLGDGGGFGILYWHVS